ncbi:MAG TPA: DUF5671 domain-containing protein [Acidimicrobiia bacterium]|nr:DUF5671 domain-containing protein [Acidimicrobiia bacterium]
MVVAGLVFLAIVGGVIALVVRAVRGRDKQDEDGGLDLIPYLLLALFVVAAGFSLAALARASLTPDRLIGQPTGELAGALAGLVVAAPIAYFLGRRQARRRKSFPQTPGWPVYLAIIELVFLIAFLAAVSQIAGFLGGEGGRADWTDLVIYGGIVVFHWWAERRERPAGDIGELPRLVGSGVALVAMTIGLIGTLEWLFSIAFDALSGLEDIPEPAVPIALAVTGAGIWGWRWLPTWDEEPTVLRNFYLGFVSAFSLTMAIGAGVGMIATLLTFALGEGGPARDHFDDVPLALAFFIAGAGLWYHHSHRLGLGRTGARRGYEYAMAAVGLGALVGSTTALVDAAFTPMLAGTNRGSTLIATACAVIASGWVWLSFWRKAQAAPRPEEARAVSRRIYLIGMAIVLGLTAAGSLIAVLVVVFRTVLGEIEASAGSLRVPVTLTLTAGLATWHLFDQIRADGSGRERTVSRPFAVTVVCSHPGTLGTRFPEEATVRILYRGDDAGVVDDEMAADIVAAVDGRSSLVWVDERGFRLAPARES